MNTSWKLSLSSFVYFNYPLTEAIKHTAAAGYRGIDIWGGRPHAYRRDLSETEIAYLRRQIESEGLAVASFIPAQFRYPTCLCSPSDTIRLDSVAYIQDSIITAANFGAPVVSVCPGHTLYGQTKVDGMHRLQDSLYKITTFASQYNLRIAIEPADRYETDLVSTCIEGFNLAESLGQENLGVLLDTGHSQVAGEPVAGVIAQIYSRLFHIHIDDNYGLRDEHKVPGDGVIDFVAVLKELNRLDYRGFLGAELEWGYTVDPDPPVSLTIERMRSFAEQALI